MDLWNLVKILKKKVEKKDIKRSEEMLNEKNFDHPNKKKKNCNN